MLRLLPFLSVLGLVASDTPVFSNTFDFTTCPINYYGTEYETAYMRITGANTFSICFDGYYGDDNVTECIVGPVVDSSTIVGLITSATDALISEYRTGVSDIPEDLECIVSFNATNSTTAADITLAKMGSRSAASADVFVSASHAFALQSGGVSYHTLTVVNSVRQYQEISLCIDSGNTYSPGETINSTDTTTCIGQICNANVSVETTQCDPMEHCDNGSCVYDSPCTVCGPGVIDFIGSYDTVEDLCEYNLLVTSSVLITGEFRDRRRKDLGLLDKVEITKSSRIISMFNDGRVLDNGSPRTLNNTPTDFSGTTLWMDDTGITATFSSSGADFIVFFTANYVQISYSEVGEPGAVMTGLCANATSLSDSRVSLATDTCINVPSEDADSTINCSLVGINCDALDSGNTISCDAVDPAPYISLCNEIMCKYPALDGFTCPFHEAYARACFLHGNTPGDWRTEISCDLPDLFCPGKTCIDDEFCGETDANTRGCLCRATTRPETYGSDTVCDDASHTASVTVYGCRLEEEGFDFRALHLIESSCTGVVDESSHTVTFSFNETNLCGAEITLNENSREVKNTIRNTDSSSLITTADQVDINFSCTFDEPDTQTISFNIEDNSVVVNLTSGEWTYNLSMNAYTDAGLSQSVTPGMDIALNDRIWVQLTTTGLDVGTVTVVTDSCWATNEESSSAVTSFYLITDGCANSGEAMVQVTGNGVGTSNSFSFLMFQFFGSSDNMYLHCQVELCDTDCVPSCGSGRRRRRSNRMRYPNEDPAIISMAWTK